MYEMLDLYEDSLVQYDELDALFTQFVLNHAAGGEVIFLLSHLIMHRTIRLTDYYRTIISDGLTG